MTYRKARFRQCEAKKTVLRLKRRHMEDRSMEAVRHPDKASQRALAEQAVSEWRNRKPELRPTNLSDILRRNY